MADMEMFLVNGWMETHTGLRPVLAYSAPSGLNAEDKKPSKGGIWLRWV